MMKYLTLGFMGFAFFLTLPVSYADSTPQDVGSGGYVLETGGTVRIKYIHDSNRICITAAIPGGTPKGQRTTTGCYRARQNPNITIEMYPTEKSNGADLRVFRVWDTENNAVCGGVVASGIGSIRGNNESVDLSCTNVESLPENFGELNMSRGNLRNKIFNNLSGVMTPTSAEDIETQTSLKFLSDLRSFNCFFVAVDTPTYKGGKSVASACYPVSREPVAGNTVQRIFDESGINLQAFFIRDTANDVVCGGSVYDNNVRNNSETGNISVDLECL